MFTEASAVMSSWSIWVWPAEMNTSHTAPSWIWVFRVPEESKLNTTVTPSFSAMYMSPISVRVSSMEAAANTVSSMSSAAPSPPQAHSASAIARAMTNVKSFFIFFIVFSPFLILSLFFLKNNDLCKIRRLRRQGGYFYLLCGGYPPPCPGFSGGYPSPRPGSIGGYAPPNPAVHFWTPKSEPKNAKTKVLDSFVLTSLYQIWNIPATEFRFNI